MAKVFDCSFDPTDPNKPSKCSLFGDVMTSILDEHCMTLTYNMVGCLYRIFFRSFAIITKSFSNKKVHKVGFSLKDDKGCFVIGTLLTYNKADDEDEGNWNLSMTFDEGDMEGCDEYIDNYNDTFMYTVGTELFADLHAHASSNADLQTLLVFFMNAIKRFLDKNSNDSSEEVTLTMDRIFEATVSFENGEKKYTIVPGYSIKQIVKNDDEAEKKD